MVAVVVNESLKEGVRDEFVEYMRECIRLTKLEEGNIAYDLYAPIDDPGLCVMIEVWETKEDLDRHMTTEHFLTYLPGGEKYKTEPSEIKIYNSL